MTSLLRIVGLGLTLLSAAGAEPSAPTLADVSYGPHERNVLDLWQAEGDGPRPLVVFIHGGGWNYGDKRQPFEQIEPFLDAGVSYAAISYRLTTEFPLPAPVHDAARAIQFLRYRAVEWNLDPSRIGLIGGSAGACTAMWLLTHDDLADLDAVDPVLRESTRVTAAAGLDGQTSIDPHVVEAWVGPAVLDHYMLYVSVGETSIEGALERYGQHKALYDEFSPYNHLTADDPPLFMAYLEDARLPAHSVGHAIHHAMLGIKMKEKADRIGHESHLRIEGEQRVNPYAPAVSFLLEKLLP